MRKLVLKISGLLVGVLLSQYSYAQCNTDDFLDDCASQLDTYTFIKAFNTALKPGAGSKQEMSYVFSKGSEYILVSCDQNNKGGKNKEDNKDKNESIKNDKEKEDDKKNSEQEKSDEDKQNEEDADDITQEVFEQVYISIGSFKGQSKYLPPLVKQL